MESAVRGKVCRVRHGKNGTRHRRGGGSAKRKVSAETNGLPSRSPPIQPPIFLRALNADIGIDHLESRVPYCGRAWAGLRKSSSGKMDTPLLISAVDAELVAARFAGLPQAQQDSVDFAAQPCQRVGIGAAFALRQQCADAAVEAKTVWRCTSVGCAVKTAVTDVLSNCRCTDLPSAFPALSLRTVSVRLPSCAAASASSWIWRRRSWCTPSAIFKIWRTGRRPRLTVGLLFVQLRQYFFNHRRAVVGSGQEFDRFDNQWRRLLRAGG